MKVEILRLDNFGRGIAYYNDKICFIENAYPEEIVEFEIVCHGPIISVGHRATQTDTQVASSKLTLQTIGILATVKIVATRLHVIGNISIS